MGYKISCESPLDKMMITHQRIYMRKEVKRFFTGRSRVIFLLVTATLFIISGCSGLSSILFIYKDYSYEVLELHPRIKEQIKKNCRANGYHPLYEVITKRGEDAIPAIINEIDPPVVFVDPLIRESPGLLARNYRDTLFFTLKRDLGGIKPPNLLTIHFDREKTFQEAGTITGNLLLKGFPGKKDTDIKGKKAGMIIYPVSSEIQRESSEYINGFTSVYAKNQFMYREVNDLEDKVKIKSIMDDMLNNGVEIFFFRLYYVNTYCLDYIQKEGKYAIVENWYSFSSYRDTLLFTINDDFPNTLHDVFQNIRTGEDNNTEWKKKEINGRVRIIWGKIKDPGE
jgi:hypothetical protein